MDFAKKPNTKPNYLYSILGVMLVLVMLGVFGILMIQANEMVKYMKEKVEIVIELKDGASEDEKDRFLNRMKSRAFVKQGSIRFIDKEDGAEILKEEFGEEFMSLDMPNPLFDVITFNINSDYLKRHSIESLTKPLKEEQPIIRDLYYQENIATMISQNLKGIGYVVLLIGLFLLMVAIFLIHNTIRLALYANRFLIKNMELVGASWEFISQPYIKKSAFHGFISGILAIVVLGIIWYLIESDLPELREVTNYQLMGLLSLILIFLGIGISAGSTFYVVNKYLRMRVDEMY